MSTTVPTEPPRLVAAPGMSLREVIASSTALLSTYVNEGRGLAQPDGPHRLVLRAPAGDLELPTGLFSLLQTSGPLVYRLRVTPHVDDGRPGQHQMDQPGVQEIPRKFIDEAVSRQLPPHCGRIEVALPERREVAGRQRRQTFGV